MIITTQGELDEYCNKWSKAEFLAIDTEFLREKTYYAKLCLVQISSPDGLAAAIDTLSDDINLSPVLDLLTDEKITKVFHAARQDLEIFYHLLGEALPAPLFDTQIAAMVLGYGEQIGYEGLVSQITGASIDKASQFTDWSKRPLTDKQISYAIGDVTHLCDVYRKLSKELNDKNRAHWMEEEEGALCDLASYNADLNDAWKRIKIRNPKPKNLIVLQHLAAWRGKKAQEKNRPRGWIMRDEVLSQLAIHMPKSQQELSDIRGIPPSLKDAHKAQKILDIIKNALATPQDKWPKRKARGTMSKEGAECLELFKMLRKIHAAQLGVAPRLLATSDDLDALARKGRAANIPLLKGWRLEVSGNQMLDLADGKISIALKDGKIQALKV